MPELNSNVVLAAAKKNMSAIVAFFKEELADEDQRVSEKDQQRIGQCLDGLARIVSNHNTIDAKFIEFWSNTMEALEKLNFSKILADINQILDKDEKNEKKLIRIFYDVTKVVDDEIKKQQRSRKAVTFSAASQAEPTADPALRIQADRNFIVALQLQLTDVDDAMKHEVSKVFSPLPLEDGKIVSPNPTEITSLKIKYEALLDIQEKINSLESSSKEAGHKKTGFSILFDSKKSSNQVVNDLKKLKEEMSRLPVTASAFKGELEELKKASYALTEKDGGKSKFKPGKGGTFTTSN